MSTILLTPQKMTTEVMEQLESNGLIIRLTPKKNNHRLSVESGGGKGEYIYKSSKTYGSHSLVNCAIDYTGFKNFGTHPDNEEFLLLGGIEEKRLLLLIALVPEKELIEKVASNTLSNNDFICLDVVFNDPEVSFFVMKKNVPHGECAYGTGLPATFYVTEGSELTLNTTDLGENKLVINSDYNLTIKD